MSQALPDQEPKRPGKFRLGLFGATRSGKTVYLTTLYWLSKKGKLPPKVSGLLPRDASSAKYLGDRYAQIEMRRWPAGNLDSENVSLDVSFGSKVVTIATNDFKGGDFTAAFYGDDPAGRERAEQFVRDLFDGCSAYLFLVDSGEIRQSVEQGGAVEATLQILRRKTCGLRAFHHPVAVVFTKADLHPECMKDPDAYGKQHLRPTWDYLQQHAGSNHKFFAVTSTGVVPADQESPPLPLRPSDNFVEPLIWCKEQHCKWVRWLWMLATIVGMFVLLVLWSALWLNNRREIADIRKAISTASDDRLTQNYRVVQDWQGLSRFILTHSRVPAQLCQDITKEAENRLEISLVNRKDPQGNLRNVDDFEEANKLIGKLAQGYPGTENAVRLNSWIEAQRRMVSGKIVKQMEDAANAGHEAKFDELMKEYMRVPCPDLDSRIESAGTTLNQVIAADQVKQLWYKWMLQPQNIDAIRERCTQAETAFITHNPTEKHRTFVRLMRATYDDLNENRNRKTDLGFRIGAASDHPVKWQFKVDGTVVAESNEWQKLMLQKNGQYEIKGGTASIDLLSTKGISIAIAVDDGTWNPFDWRDDSTLTTPTFALSRLFQQKNVPLYSKGSVSYRVIFTDVDGRIKKHFESVDQLEKLGDELFRSAH